MKLRTYAAWYSSTPIGIDFYEYELTNVSYNVAQLLRHSVYMQLPYLVYPYVRTMARIRIEKTERRIGICTRGGSTCAEEIVHALAILHMQVQRCTCTHLEVHHHTNVNVRMHPPAGRHAMQVGVEWNAGRNAGLLPAGRMVHYRVTNSSLQRVGLVISKLSPPFLFTFARLSARDRRTTTTARVPSNRLFYRAFR